MDKAKQHCVHFEPKGDGSWGTCEIKVYPNMPIETCLRKCTKRKPGDQFVRLTIPERPKVDIQPSAVPDRGVGTELGAILDWWGIEATPDCPCKQRAAMMNKLGVEWCEENIETILGWLKEEAERRNMLFVRLIAKRVVKRAIRKARKKVEDASTH